MARRTSFIVSAAVLATVAGCATTSPTQRSASWAQGQPLYRGLAQRPITQQPTTGQPTMEQPAPQQPTPQEAAMQRPTTQDMAQLQAQLAAQAQVPGAIPGMPAAIPGMPGAIAGGVPLPTAALTPGALALPPLASLAAAIPAAIPAPGTSLLATFPTLAFGFRWVDLYLPLWASSARVLAIAGLAPGLAPSILTRLHFLGINSHFGIFAPYLHWNGVFRPFFISHPHQGTNLFPFAAATGGVLTPFYYGAAGLPGAYGIAGPVPGAALSALGACPGTLAVAGCPGAPIGAPGALAATALGTLPGAAVDP